jgi:hypothetical protein
MTPNDDILPAPALEPAFTLSAVLGEATVIGRLATGGVREYRAVCGGRFTGPGAEGDLLTGGETWLRRSDGVSVVEAVYLVRTEHGSVLRLIGTGYDVDADGFAGTRMTIVVEVDEEGEFGWLSTRAFVAERPAGSDVFVIALVA